MTKIVTHFVNVNVSLVIAFSGLAINAYAGHHEEKVGSSLHQKEEVAINEVPASIFELIKKSHPGFKAKEAEKELKHGNTYFDIEGLDAKGNEIEFDMLLQKDGSWRIAEIQRDLNKKQVPALVYKTFKQASSDSQPARIIESDQGGGVIVYEFYTKGKDKEKKYEVKLTVELLEKEWKH